MAPDTSAGDAVMCPTCGERRVTRLRTLRGSHRLDRCRYCGHWFLEVSTASQKGEALYSADYGGYKPDSRFAAACRDLLSDAFVPRLRPGFKALDIGCGSGEFLAAAREIGCDARGLDISAAAVSACRARGLIADKADFLGTIPDEGPYDAITMWDVIEHLEDPYPFLRRARSLLRPDGFLFLKTPGIGSVSLAFVSAIPRLAGAVLGVPEHVQFFSKRSLSALLSRAGFGQTSWLRPRDIRQASSGGSLKRKIGRRLAGKIRELSGDQNLIAFAS